MKRAYLLIQVAIAVVPAVFPTTAIAYEFATHAVMTREAIRVSSITTSVLSGLGLADRSSDLGTTYVDMTASGDFARMANPAEPHDFGPRKIADANKLDAEKPRLPSLTGWAMLGAIREDDVALSAGSLENTPQDDPSGTQPNRVLNHFYDPTQGRGYLTPAPDWAIGSNDGNHFSITSAREAMWRALTLSRLVSGNPVSLNLPSGFPLPPDIPGERSEFEALRYAYWATVFRSLGDAVHLLQDMAQPQHTRLDDHAGRWCGEVNCMLGHASYYEGFVEAKTTGAPAFILRDQPIVGLLPDYTEHVSIGAPALTGYPIPQFGDYLSHFTSGTAGSLVGTGLSNYSNQGFLSTRTNINSGSRFLAPPQSPLAYQKETIPSSAVINAAGDHVNQGSLTFLNGAVRDYKLGGQATVIRASSYGAFDQFLQPLGRSQYTLNHYNYEDHAALLLPRAVAYSAGLLDYFFRGQLDISLPAEGVYGIVDHQVEQLPNSFGFHRLRVRVTNTTTNGDSLTGGIFVLVARYHRDKGYQWDLSGNPGGANFPGLPGRSVVEEITVSDPQQFVGAIAPNGYVPLSFDFSTPIPINATDVVLQVVYRGKLGAEDDAVAVGTKDISEPTFFGFANVTDYVWDGTGQRFVSLPFGGYSAPDDIVNLRVRFNNPAGTPVAVIPKLSAKKHAQIAVLTDIADANAYYDYRPASTTTTFPTVAMAFTPTQFYNPTNSNIYDANVKVGLKRGIYRQTYVSFSYPYDDIVVCKPGYERCSQSSLPALSPADRVNWTISF